MIKVSVFNYNINMPCNKPSIIDSVYVNTTDIGYEVVIDLKTKSFDISCYGSGNDNGVETQLVVFDDGKDKHHTVEWTPPSAMYFPSFLIQLTQVNKNQVILYYIEYRFMSNTIEQDSYECPADKLKQTFNKIIN